MGFLPQGWLCELFKALSTCGFSQEGFTAAFGWFCSTEHESQTNRVIKLLKLLAV